jgi:hypothetical protein
VSEQKNPLTKELSTGARHGRSDSSGRQTPPHKNPIHTNATKEKLPGLANSRDVGTKPKQPQQRALQPDSSSSYETETEESDPQHEGEESDDISFSEDVKKITQSLTCMLPDYWFYFLFSC